MATIATRLRPDRRKARRLTRAVSTVAIAAGLMLGGTALSSAPASAAPAGIDGTVSTQSEWVGPFPRWDYCNNDRKKSQMQGFRTTPCTRDGAGWSYQIY